MAIVEVAQVAVVHAPIIEQKTSAIYVARRDDATWFVGGSNFTDDESSRFHRIPLADLLELDSSISELADLPVGRCAFRSGPSEPWSFATVPIGPTFLIRYDARPDESNPDRDELGGAIVNCWVVTDSIESALHQTREHLALAGWIIVEVMAADYASAEDESPYFRQAQIDGIVSAFHRYPKEDLELN
jgi:hypothetical protein